MEHEPIVIERVYNAPLEKVWKAITDKEEMRQWYFNFSDFKLEVGFEFSFLGGTEEKQWLHLCQITEVVQHKKLTYSWRYDGYPGISYVTFELFPEENKTRLKLTHAGLESFPGDTVPELKKENFVMGWTEITGVALKGFLEKA